MGSCARRQSVAARRIDIKIGNIREPSFSFNSSMDWWSLEDKAAEACITSSTNIVNQ